jgi:hypothetical protein
MRSEAEVERALEIILTACSGARESGREDKIEQMAGTAMALAWMIDTPKHASRMFQRMLDKCDALDLSRAKHRKHTHR